MTGGVQRSNLGVGERGQASLLVLGLLAACTLVMFGFGQALGARGKHQRAADLAAVSAAQVMSRNYSRLFELAVFENGLPNPRHLIAMTRRSPPLCLIPQTLGIRRGSLALFWRLELPPCGGSSRKPWESGGRALLDDGPREAPNTRRRLV